MTVNEFFYKGVDIILQVYGEQEFGFRGFMFLDTGNGITTERVTCENAVYSTKDDAFKYGFEYIKSVVDNNLFS